MAGLTQNPVVVGDDLFGLEAGIAFADRSVTVSYQDYVEPVTEC